MTCCGQCPVVELGVGGIHASREPAVLRTVLGSCVSVCLYDEEAKVGGMNHIALPGHAPCASERGRYGQEAMEILIAEMQRLGARRGRMVAKVFGAARMLVSTCSLTDVAGANEAFALRYLDAAGIPVKACRTGGAHAYELRFHTHTGRTLLRAVRATA